MKKIFKSTAFLIITLYVISIFTISVSQAVSYTNSKGTVKVVCGSYSKKFTAKKYGKNFSKALNAALDTARKKASASKPATVTVSKGNYRLDRTIKIYSNTILKAKNCKFIYYGNLLRNGYNGHASSASGYNGSSNITIDGGSWDAAVPYSQAGTANWRIQHSTFRFGHCKNITIKNCTFTNNYNCHDIEFGGVDNGKITKCSFYNAKEVNTFKNDGGRESIQLDVNTAPAMPEFSRYDYTPTKNVTVSYCSFKNKFRAIGSHHAILGNTFDNIKVHHNTFNNIGGITVYGVYWTNSKIYSNTMVNVGLGVDMRNMTTGTSYNFYNSKKLSLKKCTEAVNNSKTYIYDNSISIRKKNNIYVRACGIRVLGDYYPKTDSKTGVKAGTYKIYNVNIGLNANGTYKANTIKGNVAVGIQLNYAKNSNVYNNTINADGSVSETSNGIEIKGCEKVKVSLNTVKNGKKETARGIYLTTTAAGIGNKNIEINNNSVSKFTSSGIYLYKSDKSVVENNNVNKSDDMGISVRTCLNAQVNNNTVKNAAKSAVSVYSNSDNTKLNENQITSSTKTAVTIKQSSNSVLESNNISNCGEYGAVVTQSDNTKLLENTINDTVSNGVRVNYGSDKTSLYNNSISSPNSECVYLTGANDLSKDVEKTLEVTNNYLNTDDDKAAVSVVRDNIAAHIYANYRNDGQKLYYSFKGDESESAVKVKKPIAVDDLTVVKFDTYNMLNWSFLGSEINYRVYREDETGKKLISDTPEHFCMDNELFNSLQNVVTGNTLSKGVSAEKVKILSYSVSPYKTFSNVKYIGEPVSVNLDQ